MKLKPFTDFKDDEVRTFGWLETYPAPIAFPIVDVVEKFKEAEAEPVTLAYCRHCKHTTIPTDDMAVLSWRPSMNRFEGVCGPCYFDSNDADFYA